MIRILWVAKANLFVMSDTFVRKIYVFDGEDARIEIYCNASDTSINCTIDKPLKGSSMAQLAPPARFERTTFRLGGERSILVSYGGAY